MEYWLNFDEDLVEAYYGFEDRFAPPAVMSLPLAHKPSRRLRRVRDTEAPPFRLICKLLGANLDTTDREHGTGFLVSHKHVLTAAHILLDGSNNIVDPGDVEILPGLNDTYIPFESSPAKKIHVFPAYNPGDAVTVNDIALIETDDFVAINKPDPAPGFWDMPPNKSDKIGTSIGAIVGWRSGQYRVNVGGYPVNSDIQHYSFDDTIRISRSRLSTLPSDKRANFLFIKNDIRRGMSGSPVWVKRHSSVGGRVAFAIFLGMDEIQGKRYATARLITEDVIEFINDHTGSDAIGSDAYDDIEDVFSFSE